jgi:hypothetical protein
MRFVMVSYWDTSGISIKPISGNGGVNQYLGCREEHGIVILKMGKLLIFWNM